MIKKTSEQFAGEHKIYGRYPLLKDQTWRVMEKPCDERNAYAIVKLNNERGNKK